MQEINAIKYFVEKLNLEQIKYFITGSFAAIVYGEPRLTNDVDLVLSLEEKTLEKFVQLFPINEFYCPPMEIINLEILRASRGHFNLIHHQSGLKADIYLLGKDKFQQWGMENRKEISFFDMKIFIAPPEYVIIKKLEFYQEGNVNKHLIDIEGILHNSKSLINFNFLLSEIENRGLSKIYSLIKSN
ncbi:MAG: hypothetical protein Q8T08_15810 [Ignavibacteria bacterium]|jgi:hypothetical protein|nr:hypothetical protein [Ignavibacteria bacterium]